MYFQLAHHVYQETVLKMVLALSTCHLLAQRNLGLLQRSLYSDVHGGGGRENLPCLVNSKSFPALKKGISAGVKDGNKDNSQHSPMAVLEVGGRDH